MDELKKWLSAREKNYKQGIELLARYSDNVKLLAALERHSEKQGMSTLIKEVQRTIFKFEKLGSSARKGMVSQVKRSINPVKPEANNTEEGKTNQFKIGPDQLMVDNDQDHVELRKMKNDYRDMYKERSLLHKEMRELPPDNDEKTVAKRKDISDKMKDVSGKMEDLYVSISEFDPEKLDDNSVNTNSDLENKDKGPENGKDEIPVDGAKLMKQRQNLISSLSKDKNLLKYQQKTVQEKENPIPEGPNRTKVEKRIAEKEQQLKNINKQLNAG